MEIVFAQHLDGTGSVCSIMAYAPLRRRYSGARWLLRFEPGHMHIVIPGVEVFTFLPLNKRMTRKLKKTQI